MYQALYRQYRPKTFEEVLGQDHITTTIKNQIQNNNIGHAYLFSGTKGTGKTSTAKIFSRAVNCLNPMEGNPCNQCEICEGILDETIMDVIEMDAASNRGIDDIRELKDKVMYPPSRARYKIYIVDEVHMLTEQAFNALLKTLEEPPKHLIFILATTEPEKLPATILSRCQKYDFKRISTLDIVENMDNICKRLDILVEEEALKLIARNSEGSMRDALSLLDQCISYTEGELKYEEALDILGLANRELLFKLVDNIIDRNLEETLFTVDHIIHEGKDINQFIKDLIYHFRNLLIIKTSNVPEEIIDMTTETLEMYREQAKQVSLDYILNSLDILNTAEGQAKWATQTRIILEMALIKIVKKEENKSLEDRVRELEEIIKSGKIQVAQKTSPSKREDALAAKPRERAMETRKERPTRPAAKEPQDSSKVEEKKPIVNDGKELSFKTIVNHWTNILEAVKSYRASTHGLLREGRPVSFSNNKLEIGFEDGYGFHKTAISDEKNKSLVEKIICEYFNKNITIDFIMVDEFQEEDTEEDSIQEAIDFFGEDIVEIKE